MAFFWSFHRREPDRLLTEPDLIRAHIAAPHVLSAWVARDARHWRRVALSLLIGAAVPLAGCLALGWPPEWVLLTLLLDVPVLWLCDALKPLLAAHRVQEEWAHLDEAAELDAVIEALRRPRRPRDRDLFAAAPAPAYYLSLPERSRPLPRFMHWGGIVLLLGLIGLMLVAVGHYVPLMLVPLMAGMLLRIGTALIATQRARDSTDWRPELLPEAPAPSLALSATLMFVVLWMELDLHRLLTIDPWVLGMACVALHFVMTMTVGRLGLSSVRHFVASLRIFAASDRELLKQRLSRVNA